MSKNLTRGLNYLYSLSDSVACVFLHFVKVHHLEKQKCMLAWGGVGRDGFYIPRLRTRFSNTYLLLYPYPREIDFIPVPDGFEYPRP